MSINNQIELPELLENMYEQAQACMVYGCYHYPLFTLAMEELFRFGESSFREAVKEMGVPKKVCNQKNADLQSWAYEEDFIDDARMKQWSALRSLRNSTRGGFGYSTTLQPS